jgi:hypothetical protein
LLDLEKQNWLAAKLLKDFSVLFKTNLLYRLVYWVGVYLGRLDR